jgi:fumarylacetoacetase
LPYLESAANTRAGAFDIELEVWLQTQAMRAAGQPGERISRSNFADAAYWTPAQLVAHHTVGGCALRPGDLFGSGTLSGPRPEQAGSLLELSQGGQQPLTLANGEMRTFLQDGDTVTFKAWAERAGAARIGLGECSGRVLPAV